MTRRPHGPTDVARAATTRPMGRAAEERGQAISEYLTLSGVIAAIVIAGMAAFTTPVAKLFVSVFRKYVLYFTSPS